MRVSRLAGQAAATQTPTNPATYDTDIVFNTQQALYTRYHTVYRGRLAF